MKIQCDVCGVIEASFFCNEDEAALCDSCDHRVHDANKLASSHSRFPLLHPSFPKDPLCDICQEKRAVLFCQQDRAILCSDCDAPIHTANIYTQKHDRFLLAGVRVSATSSRYMLPCVPTESTVDLRVRHEENPNQSSSKMDYSLASNAELSISSDDIVLVPGISSFTSTISTDHYLAETFLGWPAVDYFSCPSSSHFGFSMVTEHGGVLQGTETDRDRWTEKKFSSSENIGISVPERTFMCPSHNFSEMGWQGGNKARNESKNLKANQLWNVEDELSVPQIDSSSTISGNFLSFW